MDTANLQSLDLRWGSSNQVDLNTALQFASGAPYSYFNDSAWGQSLQKALAALGGGGGNIGAQNQDWYFQKVEAATKTLSDYYQQKTQELQAINPAFDPTKYENTSYKLYDAGQGEQANRDAPIVRAFNEWSAKIQSLKLAEQAAQQYQSTGVIAPYPDDPAKQEAQALVNQWGGKRLDLQDQRVLANAQNILTGEPLSAEAKATANAAAARVGAPLPYPQSGIGQIAGGGIFQTAQEAQQAYTDGQLNTVGQNIVNSNSAGNMKNGVNQATVNADGSVTWNGKAYPSKDAAALAANSVGVTSLRFGGSATGGTTGTSGGTTGATGSTAGGTAGGTTGAAGAGATGTGASATGAAGFAVDPQAQASAMAILNQYLNDGTIDNGTYQMFKKAVELWDPSQQVDFANILNTFETIKQTDINPYFQEQAALFTNELEANRDYLISSKVLENTQQQQDARKLKENMQSDLAARGMLFTGESVKQLGDQGTFAVEGTPQAQQSAIPTVAAYANGEFQQQTQAAASASNLRYEKSLQDLQRQAESYLGTTGSAGMVPGTSQIGGITGSLTEQRKAAQASTLIGLYNQQQQNVQAQSGQESQIFNEV